MNNKQKVTPPINVYYSYAPEDEELQKELEKHLSPLRRNNTIFEYSVKKIAVGMDRSKSLDEYLENAAIILLLISPNFFNSDYCYNIEMKRALERQRAGLTSVVPILISPIIWVDVPFSHLQCLPYNQEFISAWPNRDEAFIDVVNGINHTIEIIQGTSSSVLQHFSEFYSERGHRDRKRFLRYIQNIWINEYLSSSMQNSSFLMLELSEQPDAIVNPWHAVMQETDQQPHLLPSGTRIMQVFDAAEGRLLILGEPGAGKTTLLLELMREFIELAQHNAHYPLPVYLPLSTWAKNRQPLMTWVIEELGKLYSVSSEIGMQWIQEEQIVLLLDGLDEMPQVYISECLAIINQFIEDHTSILLVTCCRKSEYLAQEVRLRLRKSVTIQSLTEQKIEHYLSGSKGQLAELLTALHEDVELQEIVTSPLMLRVLMSVYEEKTFDKHELLESVHIQRREIFRLYVDRMFYRGKEEIPFSENFELTQFWLMNLARLMKRHYQTQIFVERIDLDWLTDNRTRIFYRVSIMLMCVIGVGLAIGLIYGFLFGLLAGLISGLGSGVAAGFVGWTNPKVRSTHEFLFSWANLRQYWFIVFILTITIGFASGLQSNLNYLLANVVLGTSFGGLFGVLVSIFMREQPDAIPEVKHIITPNQELRRSAQHSLLILLISLIFSLLFVLLGNHFIILLIAGFGIIGALGFGGLFCLEHFVLRFLLWRTGVLPWRLVSFLDYASERILLRKVGGGYIFMHSLLQDYFAALDQPPVDE